MEGGIDEGVAETGRTGAALGACRSEARISAAERACKAPRAVAMVAMAVGDEDMRDALAPVGVGDRASDGDRPPDPGR